MEKTSSTLSSGKSAFETSTLQVSLTGHEALFPHKTMIETPYPNIPKPLNPTTNVTTQTFQTQNSNSSFKNNTKVCAAQVSTAHQQQQHNRNQFRAITHPKRSDLSTEALKPGDITYIRHPTLSPTKLPHITIEDPNHAVNSTCSRRAESITLCCYPMSV